MKPFTSTTRGLISSIPSGKGSSKDREHCICDSRHGLVKSLTRYLTESHYCLCTRVPHALRYGKINLFGTLHSSHDSILRSVLLKHPCLLRSIRIHVLRGCQRCDCEECPCHSDFVFLEGVVLYGKEGIYIVGYFVLTSLV